MRPYEIAVIFDASLEESELREATDRVVALVRSHDGTPGRIDRWGRRTFAYELKHRTEGYYVFIEMVAAPEAVADIDRLLGLSDEVVRHRIVRQPEHVSGRKPIPASTPQAEPAAAG